MAFEVKTDYGTFSFDKEPSHDDIDEAIASVKGSTKAPETTSKTSNKDKEGNDFGNVDSQAEQRMGLKSGFLGALAHHESGNNLHATNPNSSAYGRFQMTDAAWNDVGYDPKNMDKRDPHIQSQAAGAYFANILNGPANGDYDLALRMYYQGPGASHDKLYGKDADKYVNDPVFAPFRNKNEVTPEVKPNASQSPETNPASSGTAPAGHEMDIPGNPTTPPVSPIKRDENGAPLPSVENEGWIDKVEGVGEAALSTVTGALSSMAAVPAAVLEGKGPDRAAELADSTTYHPTTPAGIRYTNIVGDVMTNVAQPILNELGMSGIHPTLTRNDVTVATGGKVLPTSAIPDTVNALQRERLAQTTATEQQKAADVAWNAAPEGSAEKESQGLIVDASQRQLDASKARQADIENTSGIKFSDVQAADAKISVLRDLNANGFHGGVGLLKKTPEDKALFDRLDIKTNPLARVVNKVESNPAGEHITKATGLSSVDVIPDRQEALLKTSQQKLNEVVNQLDLSDNNFHDDLIAAPFQYLAEGDVTGAKEALGRLNTALHPEENNIAPEFTVGQSKAQELHNYASELTKQAEATAKKAKKTPPVSGLEKLAYHTILPAVVGLSTHGILPAITAVAGKEGVGKAYSALINRHLGRQLEATSGSVSVPSSLTTIAPPPVFSNYQGDRK